MMIIWDVGKIETDFFPLLFSVIILPLEGKLLALRGGGV
jgi:hypothetical protein